MLGAKEVLHSFTFPIQQTINNRNRETVRDYTTQFNEKKLRKHFIVSSKK